MHLTRVPIIRPFQRIRRKLARIFKSLRHFFYLRWQRRKHRNYRYNHTKLAHISIWPHVPKPHRAHGHYHEIHVIVILE